MLILTGQTLVQLPLRVEANGRLLYLDIESGIDDDADRTRVSRAITQPSASAVDRAGIHARSTPDAFQRIPEIAHAETLRASVVDEHDVELAATAWCSKVRGVLCDRRA